MTEASAGTAATDDVLRSLRTRREARARDAAAAPVAAPLPPHLLAAAVLHVFDPTKLSPVGGGDAAGAFDALFDASVPAVGWQGLRTLRLDVRQRSLGQLGGPAAIERALNANEDRQQTILQRLFERAVAGGLDLGKLSFAALEEMRQLYEWKLKDVVPLPPIDDFRAAHQRRAGVARFEHLVDHDFVGRGPDLQALRDYVGVVEPSAWARARAFFSAERRPPLFVSAPGGCGKTALLGRFLLEHVSAPKNGWFPFVYCTFDSDALDIREPFTLLVEIVGQLAAQIEHAALAERRALLDEAIEAYRRSVTDYRDVRTTLGLRASAQKTQSMRLRSLGKHEERLLAQFAALLGHISREAGDQQQAKSVPVLIVFDTFEEVVYRAREDLIGFWRTLAALSKLHPPLRVIIAGRAGPDPDTSRRQGIIMHQLAELQPADAANLLGRLGVRPDARARAIASQVGGNPLSLRLAARVASQEPAGDGALEGLSTRRFGVLKVAPELIRGQLYRRILDHIHDDDIRALAHPGMVLRRVTPAIVEHVLAPVCGMIKDAGGARALFERLREEHALVRLEGDGSLRYREEVRRPMLSLMAHDKPDTVRAIHQAAMDFYASHERTDPGERAEEIYHGLMLEQDDWRLDGRWQPGLEPYLATAIEEIPLKQRIWLAQRMSIDLPPEVLAIADLDAWERLTGKKVLQLIRYRDFEPAEQLLNSRSERTPDSPLFAIQARVKMGLLRPDLAADLLDRALRGYPPLGDQARSAELMWLLSQAHLQTGDVGRAEETLAGLVDVARHLGRPLALLQALTERAAHRTVSSPEGRAVREELASALSEIDIQEAAKERSLVRLALVRLGDAYVRTAARLLPLVFPEWAHMTRSGTVEIGSVVLCEAIERLAASTVPEFAGLAEPAPTVTPVARLIDGISALLPRTEAGDVSLDQSALAGILRLIAAEASSLASATLAGIADVRDSWERDGTADEVLA